MHTYQREPDEESAGSWTYRFQRSSEPGGICYLPSGQNRDNNRFPSSETKQQDEHVKESQTESKVENLIYH